MVVIVVSIGDSFRAERVRCRTSHIAHRTSHIAHHASAG
ncbi:hypothetical protein BURPS1655_C0532 [Burkholderia pseudomallei 1655]|nr:hypothetical protein BURPS1655_C0532 [Burkholderia pseudomallei 1655]